MKLGINIAGGLIRLGVQQSADSTAAARMDNAVLALKAHVEPESDVAVFIPILVNHKAIAAKSKLLLHKVATEKKTLKKAKSHSPVDVIGEWTAKRKEPPAEEAKPKGTRKAK